MAGSNDQFKYEKDQDNIVTITMDMDGPVNAMNTAYRQLMGDAVSRLEAEQDLRGVVIASAKKTFFAGGDLNEILTIQPGDKVAFQSNIEITKNDLRRLERLPVPVVAAINGAAMGGGCEITLACNYRVMLDQPGVMIALPEVTLGLLPGAGGIVRTVHMLGLQHALPLLLKGTRLKPRQALEAGLVNELVAEPGQLLTAAKAWILAAGADAAVQPWDRKGHKIPGGNVNNPNVAMGVNAAGAMLGKETRGLLPAGPRILAVAAEASLLDFDAALIVETRGLTELALTPQAKNVINTMFFQMNDINGGKSRPQDVARSDVKKIGVLGAGMMGQGIAYVAAKAGIEVVLADISLEAAEKGKGYAEKLLDKAISRGRSTEAKKAALLNLIKPTDNYDDLDGADLIVEAVFENADLKGKVTQQAEPKLAEGGIFATNTSTLPISMLSQASRKADNFIGIHFFSPVDKMPLVEIICGEKTSDFALAKSFDFARKINKTPIVVKDSLGFFTSRTFGSFFDEGCRLLEEGVDPILIDNLAKQVGMPVGPLTVLDEVSMELMRKVNETQRDLGLYGTTYNVESSDRVGSRMINQFDRAGRHYKGGFYEYGADGSKQIWPKLYELYVKPGLEMPLEDIKDRILFRQVIESLKCLQEGVLSSAADGNIGSIMGIGAPVWTGGWIQFVNTYGLSRFADRCRELADRYGELFNPPAILQEKIAAGEQFA
ncbi:3-hydroxyacyl-CoA dehydrogenase [Pseudomaricurvus alcaniphilus]|uniref:3-hydroxyacyl-CoA dehydrogenase NAD-binding domain-containing protein n=1 Tax=Pseudomaricurvus alcaniphilus TaxID=1166482 RepID=UPI001408CFCC|nr:3-hydroxyacyl-CoA dehydrogenase NAD-binding domain-containing protein [Pseudomaricurvus alcaniphilus]NHN39019.1 3-hydroxyacyl-CoA dehydrogenase [Pseudomaricurvus alcaniphilus]